MEQAGAGRGARGGVEAAEDVETLAAVGPPMAVGEVAGNAVALAAVDARPPAGSWPAAVDAGPPAGRKLSGAQRRRKARRAAMWANQEKAVGRSDAAAFRGAAIEV